MNIKPLFSTLLFAAMFLIFGCKQGDNKSSATDESASLTKLVNDWNNAHNSKDVAVLASLYNESVDYYGRAKDKNDCIDSKLSEFKKHKDYYQQIDGDIKCEKITDTEYKCLFLKRVTYNNKTKNYPSYLVFAKQVDKWFITAESDRVTDKNISKSNDKNTSAETEYTSDVDASSDSRVQSSGDGYARIGSQYWMTTNLNVNRFRNGDIIPQAYSIEEWLNAGYEERPVWCYYEFKNENGYKYGKLYNWYAVNDIRGLAPNGWHIPSDAEWNSLSNNLGGDNQSGYSLKDNYGWYNDGNGNNESGFAGLPGGCIHDDGRFSSIGKGSSWWTSSTRNGAEAFSRHLHYKDDEMHKANYNMSSGFSVRCVRN